MRRAYSKEYSWNMEVPEKNMKRIFWSYSKRIQAVFIINALHLRALVLRRAIASREVLYIICTGWGRSLSLATHFRMSSTSSCGSSTIRRRACEQMKKSEKIGETGVVPHRQPALATILPTRAAFGRPAGRSASASGCVGSLAAR